MAFWKKLVAALPWNRPRADEPGEVPMRVGYPMDFAALNVPGHLEEDEDAFTLTLETRASTRRTSRSPCPPAASWLTQSGWKMRSLDTRDIGLTEEGQLHVEVPLAARVEQAEATAGLRHGVLTVRLPKTEEARRSTRQIPIAS